MSASEGISNPKPTIIETLGGAFTGTLLIAIVEFFWEGDSEMQRILLLAAPSVALAMRYGSIQAGNYLARRVAERRLQKDIRKAQAVCEAVLRDPTVKLHDKAIAHRNLSDLKLLEMQVNIKQVTTSMRNLEQARQRETDPRELPPVGE